MKNTLLVIVVLLVVGCGSDKQSKTENSIKPVKELTLEEKVVGTYEIMIGKTTMRLVFLENGLTEQYIDDYDKQAEGKWIIVDREIHIEDIGEEKSEGKAVFKINKDGDLNDIAYIENGKRTDRSKESQLTFKKIK